jgi:hypothetical protein
MVLGGYSKKGEYNKHIIFLNIDKPYNFEKNQTQEFYEFAHSDGKNLPTDQEVEAF